MATLTILQTGPGVTVQDQGRAGYLSYGISAGGAADGLALAEGAALLGQAPSLAAIEISGMGARFQANADIRIALTGATATAKAGDAGLVWNASHAVPAGTILTIGAPSAGTFAYLHIGGGIDTPVLLGSRAAHLSAGLGKPLEPNDTLPIGADGGDQTGLILDVEDRLSGGEIRVVPSMQSASFPKADLERFEATEFTRDIRSNRMGAKLAFAGAPFAAEGQRTVLSDVIVPGDIQATGDGAPFVLLGECQTTGGYPRIATVIPPDLPRIAQARPGDPFRFRFVSRDEALAALRDEAAMLKALPEAPRPRVRNPADIPDLLAYQLIGGVTAGEDFS